MSHELHPCASGKYKPGIGRLTLVPLENDQLCLIADWIGEKTAEALAVQIDIDPTDETSLMICWLDRMQPVGLAEILTTTFTDLHVPFQPASSELSIRFYLNTSGGLPFNLLLATVLTYIKFVLQERKVTAAIWEVHQSEALYHSIARQAGFTIFQQTTQFTLYGFRNDSHSDCSVCSDESY